MLSTDEIYELLWRDRTASAFVMAAMPSKGLKYIHSSAQDCFYIVNSSEKAYSHGDVGHWLVLIVRGHGFSRTDKRGQTREDLDKMTNVEIFDSLGSERTYNEDIMTFISKFGSCNTYSKWLSNSQCGFYSLLYVYYRARNCKQERVLNILAGIEDPRTECLRLYTVKENNDYCLPFQHY